MRKVDPLKAYFQVVALATAVCALGSGLALAWWTDLAAPQAAMLMLIVVVGTIGTLAVLFMSAKRVLDKPLAALDEYLRQVAEGNFSAEVPEMPGEGRFGSLQKSLEALAAFLSA